MAKETTKTGMTYNRVWKRAHRSVNLSTGPCSGVTQFLAPVKHIAHVRVLDFFVGQPGALLPAFCCGQDNGRPGRSSTALGEEKRALDGGEAGRGSKMSSRYCSERRWAERDPIRIWIEVEGSTMDSARLGLFILPLDAGRNGHQDKQ